MSILYPPNAAILNKYFIEIATFKVLPEDRIVDTFFKNLDPPRAHSINFEQNGYEDLLFVRNAVTIQLLFYVTLLLMALAGVLKFCRSCRCPANFSRKILWNLPVRVFFESYFETLLCTLLDVSFCDWDLQSKSASERFSRLMSMVLLANCILGPVVIFGSWWRQREEWKEDEFKTRQGSLLQGVAIDRTTLTKF